MVSSVRFSSGCPVSGGGPDPSVPVQPPSKVGTDGNDNSRFHILVADNVALVNDITTNVLTSKGYTVSSIKDHGQVMQFIGSSQRPINLVIINIGSGEGSKLIQAIKQQHPEIKILLSTGSGSTGGLGEDAVVQKPFTSEQLLSKVSELVQ